jgi:hypothetical protein
MVLLIGGHSRSGTTLLRHLCNSHLDIAITIEYNYISGLGKTYTEHISQLLKRLVHETSKKRLRPLRLSQHLKNFVFVMRYLFHIYRFSNGIIDVTAIESTLRAIYPKARIVGGKTPSYVFLLDESSTISGLSCLIIYRDCRDVTSAVLERVRARHRKNSRKQEFYTAEKVAERWVYSIEPMERYRDKIHIIRYEDLVQEPRRELEVLAKWLGVDSSGFSESIISNIRNTDIGIYKTGLTDEELETVVKIAGPIMARLGYL